MNTKICSRCDAEKELNDFYFHKQNNNYHNTCKVRFIKRKKQYDDEHKSEKKNTDKNTKNTKNKRKYIIKNIMKKINKNLKKIMKQIKTILLNETLSIKRNNIIPMKMLG